MFRFRLWRRRLRRWGLPALAACLAIAGVSGLLWYLNGDPALRAYARAESRLEEALRTEGIGAALGELDAASTDPALAGSCHALAHALGRAAYEQLGFETALQTSGDVCGSGYLHGVIETHLARNPLTPDQIDALCPAASGRCFHGLGHGLMLASNNDLPAAVAACDNLPAHPQRVQCAEGVFMEHFATDVEAHPSLYLDPEDPFAACRARPEPYRGVCALYAPRYFLRVHAARPGEDAERPYRAAFSWCLSQPAPNQPTCVKGVAEAAAKARILEPAFAIGLCDSTPEGMRDACVDGVATYVIVHYASLDRGAEFCGTLADADQATCRDTVERLRAAYAA